MREWATDEHASGKGRAAPERRTEALWNSSLRLRSSSACRVAVRATRSCAARSAASSSATVSTLRCHSSRLELPPSASCAARWVASIWAETLESSASRAATSRTTAEGALPCWRSRRA